MAAKAKKVRKRTRVPGAPDGGWPQYESRFDPAELSRRLRIDRNALDDEVERQAELYGEVGEAAAYAKSHVESMEERLKEFEASLDAEAREEAEANDERVTENAIKAIVAGSSRRKELVVSLLNARHRHRQLEALTSAFRQRSYMLRDMVDLYLASYYGTRSAAGARADHRDAEVERVQSRMADRRKKRVKSNRQRYTSSD